MATTGSKLTDLSDIALASAASSGDQRAFLVLYDRFKKGAASYASKFIPQKEEAEDVVLESFQKAFSQISTYRSEFKFSTWLFSIVRNTALDHIEKSVRVSSKISVNSIDDERMVLVNVQSGASDPEEDVIHNQEYEKLVAVIDGLPALYSEVARLVLLDNYGYQEVAQKTGLTLGTVKTRVKRARENLLKKLCEEDEN